MESIAYYHPQHRSIKFEEWSYIEQEVSTGLIVGLKVYTNTSIDHDIDLIE